MMITHIPLTNREDNIFKFIESSKFLELANADRWQGFYLIRKENTAEHSYFVALFVMFICNALEFSPKKTANALSFALLHDYDEVYTGDIRHDVKYNDIIGVEIKLLLKKYVTTILKRLPDKLLYNNFLLNLLIWQEDQLLHKVIKVADWMTMYYIMQREINTGNKTLAGDFKYCQEELLKVAMDLQEIIGKNKITNDIIFFLK